MRTALIVLSMAIGAALSVPAAAQVSFGVSLPGVSIGVNVPVYPQLVQVPGYPVYYAPNVSSNYFFYDGMYWLYQGDNWYASSWYNGPWYVVGPEAVPLYVLRVPVRYYRRPPVYFHAWRRDAPPRWGEHWGRGWEDQHRGWEHWDRASVPAPAPLPVYQRQYAGNRYPQAEQQYSLQTQNYRYQPRDAVVQQHYQAAPTRAAPSAAPAPQVAAPPPRAHPQPMGRNEPQRSAPAPAPAPQAATPPAHANRGEMQRAAPPPQVAPPPARPMATQEAHRPASGPPPAQQAMPAPRAQPPQPHGADARTAAAPPPASPRAAAPPHEAPPPRASAEAQSRGHQGNSAPQAKPRDNESEKNAQGGGK